MGCSGHVMIRCLRAFRFSSPTVNPRSCGELFRSNRPFDSQQFRFFEYLIDPKAISRREKKKGKKREKKSSWKPSYRLVDRTKVRVSGGRGGKGSLSMQQLPRKYKLRPDGGHGGNGGSVLILADPNEQTLRWSNPHVEAEKGTNGSSQDCAGRNGENLILRVPCGVVVKRVLNFDEVWDEKAKVVVKIPTSFEESNAEEWKEVNMEESDIYDSTAETPLDFEDVPEDEDGFQYHESSQREERESVVLADLDEPGSHVMVARGGRGGIGSSVYASEHGALPDARILIENAQPEPGEVAHLELTLKLIADLGLVGFPNAGKSSLLRAMSRATPEVAPYPFTTLHPILGCIDYRDGFRVRVADIPGLIDGASEGRGKGFDFLRHIERTKALIYIVDVAGVDYRNPIEDLRVLANEIGSYGDGSMLERRALLVANKVDLIANDRLPDVLSSIAENAEELGILLDHDVIPTSVGVTGEGLGRLSKAIRTVVTNAELDYGEERKVD